ncbi:pyrroline-5-carboxylate reductase [Pararhizobium polonicum]|uniref:Pyrroline-5-carboxylate reductase n=1 Tax=Pararhizobium polonicum TaxID=1612624 RepID=A0A1C7P328_9HYPH|nr:pyrroline-5-carboxylate reductase [Pararhizobium polonicum]OBZ95672.1 pyrroline-5-carboxylate reductase [Pararhizobium polonicum]
MSHIVLVGAGNMGFALLNTWSTMMEHSFSCIEPNQTLRDRAAALGVNAYGTPDELPTDVLINVLVIATKPQMVGDAVARYAPNLAANALLISVAAGISIDAIAARSDQPVAIIRAMPNTPASIGEGMIVCCSSPEAATADFKAIAEQLLSAVGRVAFVDDEVLMDAVTAVSGSGPAYIFHFIEALSAAATEAGLPGELAMLLAKQTVYGAAKLAVGSSEEPSKLREQVTSPNGTTAAALNVLMSETDGLRSLMKNAVGAAQKRSIELGK